MYTKLFSPGAIGKLKTKNRLVMPPMGIGLAELDGSPSEAMIAYYEARAKGGAGIIISEIARVNDMHGATLLRQLSVTRDRHIKPLSRMAERLHQYGSLFFVQLHHPGRETKSVLLGGQAVVAPSPIPCKVTQAETRALSNGEIKALVRQFTDGAVRARKAGCDGVELHAAHGYLLHQFLSPYTNKREDEYGGSFENRMRFINEIISGIRRGCGDDFPILVRLSVEEFLDRIGVTEPYIHLEDGVKIAVELEKRGIDAIDVSCASYEVGMFAVEPVSFPQGWRGNMLKAVKDAVKIPVIGVSALREPEVAEKFLADGIVDFVALGRPHLADPEWGAKAMRGEAGAIRKCISCLRCFQSLGEYNAVGLPTECAVNPRCARELLYGDLQHDIEGHRVTVVGGGPAGMSAAHTLASRGVKVVLLEKRDRLGGQADTAGKTPLKERMKWVADYYEYEFARLGVDVRLNTVATAALVGSLQPDAVIVATGGKPVAPASIPGITGGNVHSVEDVLWGKTKLSGKKIAVVGGGMTGLEVAEFLCAAGNTVTIVEMRNQTAPDVYVSVRMDVTARLAKYGASYKLGHALKKIGNNGIEVENVETGQTEQMACDAVVLSLGYQSDNALAKELEGVCPCVQVVGDALQIGRIGPAVRGGFEAGRSLFTAKPRQTGFHLPPEEVSRFAEVNIMYDMEGLTLAYLTYPSAIAKILPPPLKPFPMPVVSLSIRDIRRPTFAESYSEAILGCYAMFGARIGLYTISLLLDGAGAEMATQLGRDNLGIPKKLGATLRMRKEGKTVRASITRRGAQLVDLEMELGAYNHPMMGPLNQSPSYTRVSKGMAFYHMFDMTPDAAGKMRFSNVRLIGNVLETRYHDWIPGFAGLKLQSGPDDPWGDLPVHTIIGGAYMKADLHMLTAHILAEPDPGATMPYLLAARYDRTAFTEPGGK